MYKLIVVTIKSLTNLVFLFIWSISNHTSLSEQLRQEKPTLKKLSFSLSHSENPFRSRSRRREKELRLLPPSLHLPSPLGWSSKL